MGDHKLKKRGVQAQSLSWPTLFRGLLAFSKVEDRLYFGRNSKEPNQTDLAILPVAIENNVDKNQNQIYKNFKMIIK